MLSTTSLIKKLRLDFPHLKFKKSDVSRWSHSRQTIYFNPNEKNANWIILHELGHACLKHASYQRDIELISMEKDAWQYALDKLSDRYDLSIDQDFIEDHINTYRDWLHAKSTCPGCSLTGVEKSKHNYHCLGCGQGWSTNEGTQVRIQRYSKNSINKPNLT
ncbi:hypothetical protein GX865_03435 [Candidatus Saccharibacteria bacterium]|nr:hypothetical protein [Candidatus Saccharibacteria bacterium]